MELEWMERFKKDSPLKEKLNDNRKSIEREYHLERE